MARAKVYDTPAARQAAYRARKGAAVTLYLDPEVLEALDAYMARQAMDGDITLTTRSGVVTKLLKTQLLRRR